ncbi:MAG: hypothetical protein HN597_21905 [Desulfobacula sp.]|uniref:hypothetical protein n=1 Tax=Desulfobacula sp. TaxID=2593537 RepID=UPI0039B8AD68|nr:hypothetical protein [Desulfobacula sp.]
MWFVLIHAGFCFFLFGGTATANCTETFSWLPNTESNIADYTIYYGQTEGGPYANVVDVGLPGPVAGRIYATITVPACGQQYYFVCVAVNDVGIESAYSNSVVNSIIIKSDLSFKLPDVIYQDIAGEANLWAELKFFGDQNGKPIWEVYDYGLKTSANNPVTIGPDLSFKLSNAIYQSITGDINIEMYFKFFGDQNGKSLWELESYTIK